MKGIVFTEFLEMVEAEYGIEMVDTIIERSDLTSEGVYTTVGTYDFGEMLQLLTHLSTETNISINDLLYAYGCYFFSVLLHYHPDIFGWYDHPIAFLSSIENHIHVHVKKIYPDAELPTFEVIAESDKELIMIYSSDRAMYRFAEGLMEKTFQYYNKDAEISVEKINPDGTRVKFTATL